MPYKTRYIPQNASKYIGDPTKIICRSLWERKVCKWLDENKNVLRWGSEELAIPYISPKDNKKHNYYPDFIAEMKSTSGKIKTLMIEVKPKKQTSQPKKSKSKSYLQEATTYEINKSKWESAKYFCEKNGWEFVILTEDHLFPKKK